MARKLCCQFHRVLYGLPVDRVDYITDMQSGLGSNAVWSYVVYLGSGTSANAYDYTQQSNIHARAGS